ncbi:MAG: MBL fold metallo-hydrolase [Candidatus Omnitrophica bacterium]|nr:MBL fold metallo-hydrolase [Candidatus Omnitrophota bacterium]MBD3269347.1 MBL fold metallo-hydrolase [Candidatus Omnitrophota bacterium]
MDGLIIKTFALGELCANCYIVYDRLTRKGFIVDLPLFPVQISRYIEENKIEISSVLLTHGHFDHTGGLDASPYPFYIHEKDSAFLLNPELNGSVYFGNSFSVKKKPLVFSGKNIKILDNRNLEIIHTPGHTPGSVSFKIDGLIFSGDTLFAGSIGRTDLPLASHKELTESIKNKIFTSGEETLIYPGHGIPTSVGNEIRTNPFL